MIQDPKPQTPPRDNLPLAVGTILFTVLSLSFGDALVKLSSGQIGLWQIFVVRSAFAIPILIGLMVLVRPSAIGVPSGLAWIALRSGTLVAMWIAYYLSLPELPIAVAAAAYYTLPIFITLLSAVFLGDRVGPAGWTAVVVGFGGVLLVLRPDPADLNGFALLPLLAAFLYAVGMILTRGRCRNADPLLLSLALNLGFLITGGIALAFASGLDAGLSHDFLSSGWVELTWSTGFALLVMTVSIVIASVGTAVAYQRASPSIVGAFDFGYVGFAVIWGMILFDEYPDMQATLGIVMVIAAGLLSLRR